MRLKAEVWVKHDFYDGTSVSLREIFNSKHIVVTLIESDFGKYTRSIFSKEKTSIVMTVRYSSNRSIGFQFKWKNEVLK